MKLRTVPISFAGGEFFTQCADRQRKIVGLNRRGAQPLYGIPALGDRFRRLIDCASECFLGFVGARREQVISSLKMEQQPVKTLQQGVVQIPRDAGALVDALLQAHVELVSQLTEAESMKRQEQYQKRGHARHAEPRGLVVRRVDGEIQECALLVPYTTIIASHHSETV